MEMTILSKGKRILADKKGVVQIAVLSLSLLGLTMVLSAALPRPAQAQTAASDVRAAETSAGNTVADAVRAVAGADIAFVPAAAFRPGASAPRSASAEQITALVEPSSDMIVVLNLKGDQILAALERSVSFAPQPSAAFLQVSGLSFSYDAKRESQKRVLSVTVGGKSLDKSATYKVATTRPLGNGQQGYHQVWSRGSIASDTGKSLAAAISEYASKQGGNLSGNADGRIKSQ